ncbi:formimidoylglutamate deiminase [Asanoa sp. WMMD1127]|uniref:formimidoylglutamate deiminase n=1 Tax=Asanoa sp. WMMD1127 TaxID=3016107 RepID=UPI002416B4F4|nr:formimidoylglutamate deiminase [Asanoa sp. WMMD1127]MDG4820629.1 formimidoylglutamate deiminase [Asanoa sp. WMMD1127]
MSDGLWFADWAWLGSDEAPTEHVVIEVAGSRFSTITVGVATPPPGAIRLPGLTLPGLANVHSHAFHRALRGRTTDDRGSFWTWRDRMYALAGRLDPDRYLALARATYAEMALSGITTVGEFHYLHNDVDGEPYVDPNVMGTVLIEAAAQAGIRITLLDALYLTSSADGAPLEGVQLRFGDEDLDGYFTRLARLDEANVDNADNVRIGAALHSVRAVPAALLPEFAERTAGRPLHFHLSEQRAENKACLAAYGRTPTELLSDSGILGTRSTAIHATHLTDLDRTLLGDTGTGICFCPTTERDLADGIGPARALADAGSPLSLGSDSQTVIDLFEEARALEAGERLRTERRGHFMPAELVRAASVAGHNALGWADVGRIAVGERADLVTINTASPRTAGAPPVGAPLAATAADVTTVVVDGRVTVRDGHHVRIDVPAALEEAVHSLW